MYSFIHSSNPDTVPALVLINRPSLHFPNSPNNNILNGRMAPAGSLLALALLLSVSTGAIAIAAGKPTVSSLPLHRERPTGVSEIAELVQAARHREKRFGRNRTRGSASAEVYARSYGGYSITLSVGTPPQQVRAVMDTGSDLVWLPCTDRYTCVACDEGDGLADGLYSPNASSTVRLVPCGDAACGAVLGGSTGCPAGNGSATCPAYALSYGKGATLGVLVADSLTISKHVLSGFHVGCSLISTQLVSGVTGFGRGALSLPSQLAAAGIGSGSFAYCLQSHRLDDRADAGSFVNVGGAGDEPKGLRLRYTPLLTVAVNGSGHSPRAGFYYVGLRSVRVGGVRVKVPGGLLRFDGQGNGGAVVDSGTTFTLMAKPLFDRVIAAAAAAAGDRLPRAGAAENATGLALCFDVSKVAVDGEISLPTVTLHFKGGAEMELPAANYFSFVDDNSLCLTILQSSLKMGPAVVIGNYQQQNFFMLFDRPRGRLGFAPHDCSTSPHRPRPRPRSPAP